MSGFLKNLKGLFIASDEELLKSEGKSPPASIKADPSAPVDADMSMVDDITSSTEGEINQNFMEILLKGIEENDQEGFDYLEFKQSLRSLKKMDMDEETRFKSAYAMAQTMGADMNRLTSTGEFYLKILKDEEQKFLETLSAQRAAKVDSQKQKLLELDEWIAAKEKEIEQIKEAIRKKIESKSVRQKEIERSAQKINKVHSDFETTYLHLVAQIQNDLNKIRTFIKE